MQSNKKEKKNKVRGNKIKSKKKISQAITKITKGIASYLIEVLLMELAVFETILTTPASRMTMGNLNYQISRRLGAVPNLHRTQNTVYQAKKKGWITKDLKLTKQGRERLKEIFPAYHKPCQWDKKWYVVIFDIPESLKYKRDIFRQKLKQLGFGQLQQSVWISPFNYIHNVAEIIQQLDLEFYAILSITDKLGLEESQQLAERIWKLDEINQSYEKFISEYSYLKNVSKFSLKIDFFSIVKKDPQLPRELLPHNWKGEEAFNFYQKFSKT